MKRSFWSSNPFRIALAVLIVLAGAAGMIAATLQNALVIMAPSGSPSPTITLSSDPNCKHMTVQECEQGAAALKFGKTLIGKPETTALVLAASKGFMVRTVARDNESIAITADYVFARIDLWVKHGKVVKVTTG
jgi:hypothetical protein